MQDDVRNAVPRTDHQKEDALLFRSQSPGRRRVPRAITIRKKMFVDEQPRIALQKPNRRSPRARFSGGRGFRRHLLSRYSVRAEVRNGEAIGLLRCGFSQERLRKTEIWTDGGLRINSCDEKEERQRRIRGDGEADGMVTDAISSPPPSKGETPVILWIRWQKTGHARPLTWIKW